MLHHVWVPSKTSTVQARGIEYSFTTNSQSWLEERDVQRDPPPGVFRLFYVGDSNTQGVVPPEQTMVRIVERELRERCAGSGIRLEVINTGTSGYSFLFYHVLIKTRILDYHPSLVVLNVDMNDVVGDNLYRRTTVFAKDGEPLAILPSSHVDRCRYRLTPNGIVELPTSIVIRNLMVRSSQFCYYVDRALDGLLSSPDSADLDALERDERADWLAKEWTEDIERNVARSMDVLSRTIRLLKSHGVQVMVTGVPHYPQYTGEWSIRPHEVLAKVVAREGVPFMNSYEAMRDRISGTDVSEYYWATDPTHLSAAGNRIWAMAQADFLLDSRHGLLPSTPVCGR